MQQTRHQLSSQACGDASQSDLSVVYQMKKFNHVHVACLQAFAVLACSVTLPLAQAQTIQTALKPDAVTEVVVAASRVQQRIEDALPSTTLINRADIERAQTFDLPTLLRQVGGIEIGQTGGVGSQTSAFIRGSNSNHTLVLVDGVPINNLNFGTADIQHIPLSNVERIEIVRGNVASLYGSSAIGGVIQIFTRDSGQSKYANVSVQKGSRNYSSFSASAAVKLNSATRLSASVETLSDSGVSAINSDKVPLTNPDSDGYKRQAYSLGVQQDIGKDHRIGLTVRSAKGRSQFDDSYGSVAAVKQADEIFFESQATVASGRFKLAPDVLFNVSLTESNEKFNNDVGAYPSYVTSKTAQKTASVDWSVNLSNLLSMGIDQQIQKIESGTIYSNVSRNLDGIRLGYRTDLGAHQIQMNIRQDKYSDFGSASTHLLGYAYRINTAWRVNASQSTGFNAPTFNDLYYPFGSGNANLRPERVESYELGLQYAQKQQQTRVVWFQNHYRDLIVNNTMYQRENIDLARNTGIEITNKTVLGQTTVNASLTMHDPRNLTSNTDLIRRAKTLGFVNIQQDRGAWQMGANLRGSSSRIDTQNQTLAAYSLLDLTVAYRLDETKRVTARIDNATNRVFESVYGYNQPGRAVFVGLNWKI